jgi:hypothetical protein
MTPRRRNEAQTELFAIPAHVEKLDPKRLLGAATRVVGLWRVRLDDGRGPHMIFRDRHGVYCEEHGPRCRAVKEVPAP